MGCLPLEPDRWRDADERIGAVMNQLTSVDSGSCQPVSEQIKQEFATARSGMQRDPDVATAFSLGLLAKIAAWLAGRPEVRTSRGSIILQDRGRRTHLMELCERTLVEHAQFLFDETTVPPQVKAICLYIDEHLADDLSSKALRKTTKISTVWRERRSAVRQGRGFRAMFDCGGCSTRPR